MTIAFRALVALGVFGLFGICFGTACVGSASSPSEPGGAIFFTTLAQAAVPGQSGGQIRQVIRDAATLAQVWAELRVGSALSEAPPAVDFKIDMVVVAAMATQPCVSQVTVQAITGDAGKTGNIRVDVLEEPPASNCRCIVSQRPFHVVKLPRTDGSVQFSVTSKPRAC